MGKLLGILLAPLRLIAGFNALPMLPRMAIVGLPLLTVLIFLAIQKRWLMMGMVVLVLLLVVGVLWLIGWIAQRRNRRMAAAFDHDLAAGEAVQELKGQWERAVLELKSTGVDRYKMGFYMLLGEPQSGKSTTLRKSGLNFPIGMDAISGIGGTRNCDWWFTDEAVILDTAGRMTFQEEGSTDKEEFRQFLGMLRRYRKRCPINGVIITIPCTSLLSDDRETREEKAAVIREVLVDIQRGLEIQFPAYVLITKSDQIAGFTEFFSRLKSIEQTQLFGWSRAAEKLRDPFTSDELRTALQGMVDRLARWRMLLLSDVDGSLQAVERNRLFSFPAEFAAVREPLELYLQAIFPESRLVEPLFFRGIYFTSGIQKGTPVAQACTAMLAGKNSADTQQLEKIFKTERAFFIRDFYRKKVFKEPGLLVPTQARVKRVRLWERLGYGLAATLALVGTITFAVDLSKVWRQVNHPNDTLRLAAALAEKKGDTARAHVDEALGVLQRICEIPDLEEPEEALAGFVVNLDAGDTLDTVGVIPFIGSSDNTRIRDEFVALYRWVFVQDVLTRIAEPISRSLESVTLEDLKDPREFRRFQAAFECYLALLGQERGGAAPPSLTPLLEQTRNLDPGLMSVLPRIRSAYSVLYRLAGSGWLPPQETGDKLVGLGVGAPFRDRSHPVIRNALAALGDRWRDSAFPAHRYWITPLDEPGLPDRDAVLQACYPWFRMHRLRVELESDRDGLVARMLQLTSDFGFDDVTRFALADGGDGPPGFLPAFRSFDQRYQELASLSANGGPQLIAWPAAYEAFREHYGAERSRVGALVQESGWGESFDEYWPSLDRMQLAPDRPLLESMQSRFDAALGNTDRLLALGIEPPPQAPGTEKNVLRSSQGIQITPAFQSQQRELALTASIAQELADLGVPGGRTEVKNERWRNTTGREFLFNVDKVLAEHDRRLAGTFQPAGSEELVFEKTPDARRLLARAVKTRFLANVQEAYAADPGATALLDEAAGLCAASFPATHPLASSVELDRRFGPGAAPKVVAYLYELDRWSNGGSFTAFGDPRVFTQAMDRAGVAYLNAWDQYWGDRYHAPLAERLKALPTTQDWDALFRDVYGALIPDSIPTDSEALRAYFQRCFEASVLDDDPRLASASLSTLPELERRYRTLQTRWKPTRLLPESDSGHADHPKMAAALQSFLQEFFRALQVVNQSRTREERTRVILGDTRLAASLAWPMEQRNLLQRRDRGDGATIPPLERLCEFAQKAQNILSVEATAEAKAQWKKIYEGPFRGLEFPFLTAGRSSGPTITTARFEDVDLALTSFSNLMKTFGPLIGLRGPTQRTDKSPRQPTHYLHLVVPREVGDFWEQCRDLQQLLYGSFSPAAMQSIPLGIGLTREDQGTDLSVRNLKPYLVLQLGSRQVHFTWPPDEPQATDWRFRQHGSASLKASENSPQYTPDANAPDASGDFALLALIHALRPTPVQEARDGLVQVLKEDPAQPDPWRVDSTVYRNITIFEDKNSKGNLGLKFVFKDRIFPREFPNLAFGDWP